LPLLGFPMRAIFGSGSGDRAGFKPLEKLNTSEGIPQRTTMLHASDLRSAISKLSALM